MITLFHRLSAYYAAYPGLPPLNHLQKSTLGRTVAIHWYSQAGATKLEITTSTEDTGTFTVLSYPDFFATEIDKMIGDFYVQITPKKKRERIPAKRKPEASVKPSNNITERNGDF